MCALHIRESVRNFQPDVSCMATLATLPSWLANLQFIQRISSPQTSKFFTLCCSFLWKKFKKCHQCCVLPLSQVANSLQVCKTKLPIFFSSMQSRQYQSGDRRTDNMCLTHTHTTLHTEGFAPISPIGNILKILVIVACK